MATYKVLQDIEGEDHLILWLTPKQTIYAAIALVSCGLAFVMGRVNLLLAIPWLLPIGFFGFLAAPLGKDQPNDVWAAAQLRFYLKNRKRIWDQAGMQELVHITVPKRIEKIYTDGLDQSEVRSRLKALSTTIDSRGWAIKNSMVNVSSAPQFTSQFTQASEERLVGSESLAQDVPMADVTAADDIMDAENNSVAQRFDEEIKRQAEFHKQQLAQQIRQNSQAPTQQAPADFYFLNQPDPALAVQQQSTASAPAPQLATFSSQVVTPGEAHEQTFATQQATVADADADAQALLEKIHHDKEIAEEISQHSREKVVRTPDQVAEDERMEAARIAEANRLAAEAERHRQAEEALARKSASNTAPDAILKELSRSDLKISTLATQAKHSAESTNKDGEVVISLH